MKLRYLVLVVYVFLAGCGGSSDTAAEPGVSLAFADEQSEFLVANAARENVIVTESGLQYEVLTEAEGARPTPQSNITVHYVGTLIDGTVFDSSVARGQPATFQLSGTIAGWVEGLQLMSVGSKFQFFIPSDLAYGDRGTGSVIDPGDTLIFVVELLEINSN